MKIGLNMNSAKRLSIIVSLAFLAACSASDLGTTPGLGNEIGVNLRLNWAAPTERVGDTQLLSSEIDTYRVYYGNNSGYYQHQIDSSKVTYDGADIINFQSGTYYFVVTTIDTDGRESQYSEEIIIEI